MNLPFRLAKHRAAQLIAIAVSSFFPFISNAEASKHSENWLCLEVDKLKRAANDMEQLNSLLERADHLQIIGNHATFGESYPGLPDIVYQVLADGNGLLIMAGGYVSIRDAECVQSREAAGLPYDKTICIKDCPTGNPVFSTSEKTPEFLIACDVSYSPATHEELNGNLIWINLILDRAANTLERTIFDAANRSTTVDTLTCSLK